MKQTTPVETLMTPGEVAALFHVDPKTVSSWADSGKLSVVKTLGGHRRFREAEVLELRNSRFARERTHG